MKLFKRENTAGFTLIELLIAIAIFGIALPSFFVFLNSQVFKTKLSSDMSTALFLAETKMEELMNKSYTDTDLADSNSGNNNNLNVTIDKNSILNNYTSYTSSTFDHTANTTILSNNTFYTFWNIAEDSTIKTTNKFKKIGVIVYWIWQGKGHKVFLISLKREE